MLNVWLQLLVCLTFFISTLFGDENFLNILATAIGDNHDLQRQQP